MVIGTTIPEKLASPRHHPVRSTVGSTVQCWQWRHFAPVEWIAVMMMAIAINMCINS